jgi:hypothetical protein
MRKPTERARACLRVPLHPPLHIHIHTPSCRPLPTATQAPFHPIFSREREIPPLPTFPFLSPNPFPLDRPNLKPACLSIHFRSPPSPPVHGGRGNTSVGEDGFRLGTGLPSVPLPVTLVRIPVRQQLVLVLSTNGDVLHRRRGVVNAPPCCFFGSGSGELSLLPRIRVRVRVLE